PRDADVARPEAREDFRRARFSRSGLSQMRRELVREDRRRERNRRAEEEHAWMRIGFEEPRADRRADGAQEERPGQRADAAHEPAPRPPARRDAERDAERRAEREPRARFFSRREIHVEPRVCAERAEPATEQRPEHELEPHARDANR